MVVMYVKLKNNTIILIKENTALTEQQKYNLEKIDTGKYIIEDLKNTINEGQIIISEEKRQNRITSTDIIVANNLIQQYKETIKELELKKAELTSSEKKSLANISELNLSNKYLNESLQTQKTEIERIQKEFKIGFENIASKIIEENSRKITITNKENIDTILKPLGESINDFKTQIKTNLTEETKQRTSLQEQVIGLLKQTDMVTKQAENLASALKGKSKIRGNWGEMILESVLQKSGLTEGREYDRQKGTRDVDNNTIVLPDIIINLPNNRKIIVDSKVSLVDYEVYSSSENTSEQEDALKRHITSVKQHIDSLSSKEYNKKVGSSADFTMMFIPIEPAYMAALEKDGDLWEYAYKKGIMLVSPSNLMPCMKLVDDMWTKDKITRNAKDIVNRGEQLYNQLRLVMESFNRVGEALSRAQDEYSIAKTRITDGKGCLTWQAETLRSMGVKPSKQIPGSEDIITNMLETEIE